ncbi:ribosome maturation factor RimP [Desulfobacterales bacterium HSG17]|nr:ribosome maturation factor RimP [Desulfobacterales bacterium HSG17]
MGTQRKKTKLNKPKFNKSGHGSKKNDKEDRSFSPVKEKELLGIVADLAEPLCETEGLELVHIEFQREAQGRILRLYIDKPGGVKLDDCVCISRQLSDLLDVSIEQDIAYSLEVSSPGLDRPLGKESDYEMFKGRIVMIKTSQPVEGKNKYQGTLLGISDRVVSILVNDKTVLIPHDLINRARLVNNNGENRC